MEQHFPFQAATLPYGYVDIMPYCDANTLYYHHDEYYANAVYELNSLVVRHRLTHLSLEQLIEEDIDLPAAQLKRLKSAAGSVYNHRLFFDSTACKAGSPPFNRLTEAITTAYGSMEAFRRLLAEAAGSLIGSGWVWLVAEGNRGVHMAVTEDNDVVDLASVTPILVLDMWEHAYITLDHFDKAAYVDTWFSLIDWSKAEQRYIAAISSGAQG